jgi:hypothetical protein
MRQTKNLYLPNLAANTVAQIGAIDKAGAKVRIVHLAAIGINSPALTFILRDSSRRYEIANYFSSIMFQYFIDKAGKLRTPIELEGNIVFEIKNNSTTLATSDLTASILYDITYDDQKLKEDFV